MKHLLFFLLAFVLSTTAGAQGYTAPIKYGNGVPTAAPSNNGSGYYRNNLTGILYEWNQTAWQEFPHGVVQISGSGAPAFSPSYGQSNLAINGDPLEPKMYKYKGPGPTDWLCLNCGGDAQTLAFSSPNLAISNGNSVDLSGLKDNWGAQTVVTGATLSGNGTSGQPLGLAQQGASSGQVLKWNGTAWLPASDNTGALNVNGGTGISVTGTPPNVTVTNTGDLSPTNEIQSLSLSGGTLSLSLGGGSVNVDPSSTNELQTLVLDGLSLSISGGNSVSLPAGLGWPLFAPTSGNNPPSYGFDDWSGSGLFTDIYGLLTLQAFSGEDYGRPVLVIGGNGPTGGEVFLMGGQGSSYGGNVHLNSGASDGTSGSVDISTRDGASVGEIDIFAGSAYGGVGSNAGIVEIKGGGSDADGVNPGFVRITGGRGGKGTENPGADVVLVGGQSQIVGKDGKVLVEGAGLVPPSKDSSAISSLIDMYDGQLVYNIQSLKYNFWDGAQWVELGGGAGGGGGASDGNGIYSSSDTVPNGTVATILSGQEFWFERQISDRQSVLSGVFEGSPVTEWHGLAGAKTADELNFYGMIGWDEGSDYQGQFVAQSSDGDGYQSSLYVSPGTVSISSRNVSGTRQSTVTVGREEIFFTSEQAMLFSSRNHTASGSTGNLEFRTGTGYDGSGQMLFVVGDAVNGSAGGFAGAAGNAPTTGGVYGGGIQFVAGFGANGGGVLFSAGESYEDFGFGGSVAFSGGNAHGSNAQAGSVQINAGSNYDALGGNVFLGGGGGSNTANSGAVYVGGTGLEFPRLTSSVIASIPNLLAGRTLFCTNCTAVDGSTGVLQTWNGSTWKRHW